jgi:hypothetical protein
MARPSWPKVGLMQTLAIEGAKHNIRVNALAPTAATRMTAGLLPEPVLEALKPEAVVPAMLVLAHESAPTRTIVCAGAGGFEAAHITMTGIYLGMGETVPRSWPRAGRSHGQRRPAGAGQRRRPGTGGSGQGHESAWTLIKAKSPHFCPVRAARAAGGCD